MDINRDMIRDIKLFVFPMYLVDLVHILVMLETKIHSLIPYCLQTHSRTYLNNMFSSLSIGDGGDNVDDDERAGTKEVDNESNSVCSKRNIPPALHDTTENTRLLHENYMIQQYMIDRKMEIFAIVEGIDSTTGGSCQARHSFIPSEIEWDKSFAPCVFEDRDGSAVIDFSVFHDLVDVPSNATSCGHTSSYT